MKTTSCRGQRPTGRCRCSRASASSCWGLRGHIAGVINPPAKGKRSHWTNEDRRQAAGHGRGLVRRRHRTCRQLVARMVGLAEASMAGKLVAAPKAPGNRQSSRPSSPRRAATSRPRPRPRVSFHPQETSTMSTTDIVIVAAARTAVGKFGGTLAKTPASELGATVIKALLERAGLEGEPDRRGHPRPGADGRSRPEPGTPGRHQEPACPTACRHDDQQGLRLRPEGRDAGRAGHPRRRQRDHHRRRPGEHEHEPARAELVRATASAWATGRWSTR